MLDKFLGMPILYNLRDIPTVIIWYINRKQNSPACQYII